VVEAIQGVHRVLKPAVIDQGGFNIEQIDANISGLAARNT
jgi:hypothetical protein